MREKRRLWEGVKSLLIVLLTCSAVYLASRVFFPRQSQSRSASAGSDAAATAPSATFSAQTIRPTAFAVTWDEGRYGVLYHQEDQESYTQVSALLAEALSAAGSPSQSSRAVWQKALDEPGFFCEYPGPTPLDSLARWLSGQQRPSLSGFQARRLCVTADGLYFQDPSDALWVCPLEADLTGALQGLFDLSSPNGARFAFEDAGYRHLRSDSLILPGTPSLPQLSAQDPVTPRSDGQPGEALVQLLQTLSFHPQTNPLYDITGGWAITDSGETLRIGLAGQITYRRSDDSQVRFEAQDPVDATRALAEKTVGALGGSARLTLLQVQAEGEATIVRYGYAYRGASILVHGEDWCAQFTVDNGAVTAFTLRPRRYTVLENSPVLLLPQEQAAAALPGGGQQSLELFYDDSGAAQPISPFWAVRTEEG